MRRLLAAAAPPMPSAPRPEDVCDKSGTNKCGTQALHIFLSDYAAPAGWICTLLASMLAFVQARSHCGV